MKVVFIVDDHKLIADTLAAIFRSLGYEAEAFYSPASAIQAGSRNMPDVLVTDFCMPEMDGLTLACRMTDQKADCKIIVMSGDVAAARQHPARDKYPVLEKPVSIALLLRLLGIADVLPADSKANPSAA